MKREGYVFGDESYLITGAAMHVHTTLGPGFLESVYQEALEIEFKKRNIPYEREVSLKVYYEGQELKSAFRLDFLCYGKIVVELKAVDNLSSVHFSQVLNYLKVGKYKLGILLNFGHSPKLQYERVIN